MSNSTEQVEAEPLDLAGVLGPLVGEAEVRAVHLNIPQGHIGFIYDGERPAYFTDHGDRHLHLWAGTSLAFTPESAHALGEALIEWARMRGGVPDADTP